MSAPSQITPERWRQIFADVDRSVWFFVDLETNLIIDNVEHNPEPVCVQYAFGDDDVDIISYSLERERFIATWQAALENPDVLIVGWNILFDVAVLHRWCPELRPLLWWATDHGRIFDAALIEQLIDMRSGDFSGEGKCKFVWDSETRESKRYGYGLVDAENFYKFPDVDMHNKKGADSWRLRYSELRWVPVEEWPDDAVVYAALDITGLCYVLGRQLKSLDMNDRSDFSLLHRAAEETSKGVALTLNSCKSFRTDEARTKELSAKVYKQRDEAVKRLSETLHDDHECPEPGRPICPGCCTLMKPQKNHPNSYTCKACGRVKGGVCTHRLVDPPRAKMSGKDKGGMTDTHANTKLLRSVVHDLCVENKLPIPQTPTGMVAVGALELMKIASVLKKKADDAGIVDRRVSALTNQVDFDRTGKLISTYLSILPLGFHNGVMYSVTPLLGTGRCSVEQPPLQQLPRKGGVRECFIPEPGMRLVSCDYTTLELRTLAQSCLWIVGWSKLADALNAGLDPHLDLAAQILGISYKEALFRFDTGDEDIREWRQLAKIANFGFPGGLQPDAFVDYALGYGKVISSDLAYTLYANWQRKWPEVVPFFAHIKRLTGHKGGTVTLGAPPDSDIIDGLTRGGIIFTEAANYNFQGPAARGAKHANYLVTRACYYDEESPLYGLADVLLFLHDEVILQCPDDDDICTIIANELQRLMIEAMRLFVPDIVILAQPVAMPRWIKGAEPTYSADGKLLLLTQEKEKKAA